jgi:hypothetical protein
LLSVQGYNGIKRNIRLGDTFEATGMSHNTVKKGAIEIDAKTNKSIYSLSSELRNRGYAVSAESVGTLLKEQGYRLQTNRKTKEGKQHPDRNAQFEYINELSLRFMRQRQPVISVDAKKKELAGNYANKGKEWGPKGKPLEVKVHDFTDKKLGKAIPYGV